MLAILVRYVQSRRQLLGWDVQYEAASGSFGFSASRLPCPKLKARRDEAGRETSTTDGS